MVAESESIPSAAAEHSASPPEDGNEVNEAQAHPSSTEHEHEDIPVLEPVAEEEESTLEIDSALGSYAASTYTISSSFAAAIVEENGRTYHVYKDGKYMLPNDEIELNRLDMQHKMWSITLDEKLHLAPIGPNPQNVLDIGTGTAIWAIEFAITYPSAQVIGTDLSLSQPDFVPDNLRFEMSDAEDAESWLFPQKFDYIHGRALATCFKDPLTVIKRAFSALAPGGYLELQDFCLQTATKPTSPFFNSALYKWQSYVKEATAFTGIPWTNVPNYGRWMKEAGFEDVKEVWFRWPSCQWSDNWKERLLGAWVQAQIDNGMLESISTRLFIGKLGWSKEKLDSFLEQAKIDSRDTEMEVYSPTCVVWGRRPLAPN